MTSLVLVTLGVGAARSPRYAPAGLLVEAGGARIMIDGGPGAEPPRAIDAWLVTDDHAELIGKIRSLAHARGMEVATGDAVRGPIHVRFRPVVHTNHVTGGYLIDCGGWKVVWAPEFLRFPAWASGADLMFAEASGWARPIRFARGAGGHMAALDVAAAAQDHGVKRLVFAHIGRPTIRAIERGERPRFGEFAHDGEVFRCGVRPRAIAGRRSTATQNARPSAASA